MGTQQVESQQPHAAAAPASLQDLVITSAVGGLILIGPKAEAPPGLDALLSSPEVAPVEAAVEELSSWSTAPAAMARLTRQASKCIRDGKTAVVYLDAHAGGPSAEAEKHDFLCARLARIMVGLADPPAFVGVHGQRLAHALVVDALKDDPTSIGAIGGQLPVILLRGRMFALTPVAISSGSAAVTSMVQALDWFEARRASCL